MAEIKLKRRTPTGRAVHVLREYARYIDEHAEALVGDIDPPNYVAAGGIHVEFDIREDELPNVTVSKNYLVLNSSKTT